MKYSYSWLKELSGSKKTVEEIAELLTFHAFEIEGIEKNEKISDQVVVGEILEIQPHPNADKLQLTRVNVGKKELSIVCGARNIQVGNKVPVALVGAKLPGNFEIKEAEIRGVKSFGMLCAEDELGLGDDHGGILILDQDLEVGTFLSKVLELDDSVIEIDVLANRAHDALSHVGMAREIAALEGREIDYDYDGLVLNWKKTPKMKVSIKVEDGEICSRYGTAYLEKLEVGPSPQWLQNRLKTCGLRPINNVVDATNYVMLELGQPLHAFDADKIDSKIQIRRAKKGEQLKILDGSVKKLSSQDIVIAEAEKVLALAGVMGGFDSGVNEKTKNIILEAANFNPAMIRRTRTGLGISSDAALRFEKGLDPNLTEKALVRVVEILEHIAGAELVGAGDQYSQKPKKKIVELKLDYVESLLGIKISENEIRKILENLGLVIEKKAKNWKVEVPTFRLDLETQEDLIEEIGRVYGYEKIPAIAPSAPLQIPKINPERNFERKLKNILVAEGFSEVYNYAFYEEKDTEIAQIHGQKHVELANSLNSWQNLMRISLFPGLLKNVRENLKNFKEFSIFEIGRIYCSSEDILPLEKKRLSGIFVFDFGKKETKKGGEFFQAKGYLDNVLKNIGLESHYYHQLEIEADQKYPNLWHPGRTSEIKLENSGQKIGVLGEINPALLKKLDIEKKVIGFDFDLKELSQISQGEMEYQPLRKYPTVMRDLSLVSPQAVKVDDILSSIQALGGSLVLDVDLFDIFDFEDGSTSFGFHVVLGADDHTLKGSEIEDILKKIVEGLEKEYQMTIRS